MNKLNIILIIITISLSTSCKSKKEATSIENKNAVNQTEEMSAHTQKDQVLETKKVALDEAKTVDLKADNKQEIIYSMVVSFFSRGSGIDFKIAREFDNYIKKFEAEHSENFVYEIVTWGREGEVDYCIQFPKLNKEMARIFVDGSNEILSKTELVHSKLDAECKRKR